MSAIPYHAPIDMFGNELLNAVMHRATTASPPPTSGSVSGGMLWYDTTLNIGKYYDGANSAFVPFIHFMPLAALGATPASDDYFLFWDASATTYKKVLYSDVVTGSGTDELVATANGEMPGYLGTNGTDGVLRCSANGGFAVTHVSGSGSTPGYMTMYLWASNIPDGTTIPGLATNSWVLFSDNTGGAVYKTLVSNLRTLLQLSLGTEFEATATITNHVLNWDDVTAGKALLSPALTTGKPSFRTIVATDLPIIPVTHGGTGANLSASLAQGSIMYGNNTTTYTNLAIGASSTILTSSGTVPQWSTITSLLPANIQYGVSFTINDTTDWAGVGPFTLTINNTGGTKNHNLGTGDNFDVIILKGSSGPYEMAMANWTVNNGTIIITSHAKIACKVLVRRFGS